MQALGAPVCEVRFGEGVAVGVRCGVGAERFVDDVVFEGTAGAGGDAGLGCVSEGIGGKEMD